MIPSCFCGGCLTCAMHQEALAWLARPRDLAKAVVPIAHGGGSVANPHGPGGFEGRAAAFFRSCRESSTWCELFVAATLFEGRESDVWPRGTVARRRLGKARRLRESC